VKVTGTSLPEVLCIEPAVHQDARGCFVDTFHPARYRDAGITATFVQDSISRSTKHTVRGLHFQEPNAQGKLVFVVKGAIFDVAVDIRRGSPRFGAWAGVELSEDNRKQIWIPAGFAHGFLALSDVADVYYKLTAPYSPDCEHRIQWNDPAVGIRWPIQGEPSLLPRDLDAPPLASAPVLPRYGETV
jgi:dTDP-4-dehydrorhamnose 3,5-epimerase